MEDYTKIYDIPPVPPEIIQAVNSNKFAVFIGAGISRLAGCISWPELALKLVDKCYLLNTKGKITGKLNFRQKEKLKDGADYKKIITIIEKIYSENGSTKLFYKAVKNLVNKKSEKPECPEIYQELIGIRGLFLTTNIDTYFDELFDTRVVYLDQDFDYEHVDRTKLYHLHGSITKPEDMVLTLEDYFDRYQEKKRLHKFLSEIFKVYSILFIGYGLSEFEILDYLFTKFAEKSGQQHFILLPFFEGEESYLKLEQYYYGTMHITPIAFRADDKGHGRLGYVIKEWVKEIKLRSGDLLNRYKEIDDIVEKVEHD